MQESIDPIDPPVSNWPTQIKKIIMIGYICLCTSSFCLYFSTSIFNTSEDQYGTISAFFMMAARTAGMGAFFIGAFAILNKRWAHGILLFLGSIGLPMISLFFHGFF